MLVDNFSGKAWGSLYDSVSQTMFRDKVCSQKFFDVGGRVGNPSKLKKFFTDVEFLSPKPPGYPPVYDTQVQYLKNFFSWIYTMLYECPLGQVMTFLASK